MLSSQLPPARHADLLVESVAASLCRVKDVRSGECFQMGEQEGLLLSLLDGRHTRDDIRAAYQRRFGENLADNELQQFIDLALEQGLIPPQAPAEDAAEAASAGRREYFERFPQSGVCHARAKRVIAGATTHDRRDFGPFPVFVERAAGPWKWEASGQRLVDYWMGHGALICGHQFKPVVDALVAQAQRGTHYGACHESEVRWAELIGKLIPSADRVRYTASGTEAIHLAMRAARAYTGRPLIVRFDGHFHGWHDEAMAHFYPPEVAGFNPGTLANVGVAADGSIDSVVKFLETGRVAGVLLEPGGGSAGGFPWSADFLKALRKATTEFGSLLIFDEVISGFRQHPGGVQKLTGVLPDLTTLAKIMCGGLPGGALVGKTEVMAVFGPGTMRGGRLAQVPHTGTFNGNPLTAAAGIALLEHIADGRPQEKARAAAGSLVTGVNQAAEDERVDVFLYANDSSVFHILIGARQAGVPLAPSAAIRDMSKAHPHLYAQLRRALLLEGLDTNPVHGWVSAAHDPEAIDFSITAFARAFRRVREVEGFRLQGR